MNILRKSWLILAAAAIASQATLAELQVRGTDTEGRKLVYDTVLDVTWYDFSFGTDSWSNVVAWADGLSVNFGGNIYDTWRLPQSLPVNNVAYDYDYSTDGTTDVGSNITSANAELSHLFYVSLGNSFVDDPDYFPGIHDKGPFVNLEEWYYWYGTEYMGPPGNGDIDVDGDGTPDAYADTRGFFFLFQNGFQDSWGNMSNYGIAVLDGDVSPIPVPAAVWCFGGGWLAFVQISRRRRVAGGDVRLAK